MTNAFEADDLRKRLDIIILLLLESVEGREQSFPQKVERLLELGLSQSDVAQVTNKKLNHITTIVARMKKRQQKKKASKK